MSEITFAASIVRVKTLVDGGIRVELDLSEDCIPQMAMLAEARREGIPLIFRAEVEKQVKTITGNNYDVQARRERKSIRATA